MELQNDFDRLYFFESARRVSEEVYAKNPLDAENLTRWGGALLELSQFQNPEDSQKYMDEAISKLEEALVINPKKHEALWYLGNCQTSRAFLISETKEANDYFNKALLYYSKAVEEDPGNQLYQKSLQVAVKAPQLHSEVQKGGYASQILGVGPSTITTTAKAAQKKKSSDFKYDVLGWVFLAAGLVAWIGFAKYHMPPSR